MCVFHFPPGALTTKFLNRNWCLSLSNLSKQNFYRFTFRDNRNEWMYFFFLAFCVSVWNFIKNIFHLHAYVSNDIKSLPIPFHFHFISFLFCLSLLLPGISLLISYFKMIANSFLFCVFMAVNIIIVVKNSIPHQQHPWKQSFPNHFHSQSFSENFSSIYFNFLYKKKHFFHNFFIILIYKSM